MLIISKSTPQNYIFNTETISIILLIFDNILTIHLFRYIYFYKMGFKHPIMNFN